MKALYALSLLFILTFSSCDSTGFSNKNNNVNEMVEVMENFHDECIGESKHFQGSGERSLFRSWDNKFDKKDVDQAIEKLKPTLLTDYEISQEMLGHIILNLSDRKIK